MSLSKDSYINASDFNALKDRVLNEVKRRGTVALDKTLGSEYNHDAFTSLPSLSNITASTQSIQTSYFNTLLKFFTNFKYYDSDNKAYYFNKADLNKIYQDANVDPGDIIYALNLLSTLLSALEKEKRADNDDCKSGCMGLCTNACSNSCKEGCTGCKGCSGDCKNDCDSTCTGDCSTGCFGCGDGCTTTCGKGCSSIGMHPNG